MALIVPEKTSPTFPTIAAINNRTHLLELGINALELLPPADSTQPHAWGYGTANYFAPYYFLGLAPGSSQSTASYDLTHLIKTCHQNGIRFFKDAVMAFCYDMPYRNINYLDRLLGFRDGSQAINYITSHDVGGMGNERLYNWLDFARVSEKEQRAKLAFVCLLTAVGVPMILAGEEFVDEMEPINFDPNISEDERNKIKQVDPVNFDRLNDDWRQQVFHYVARLVKFRTTSNALAVNDTNFIHVDFNEGKRVVVWQRGIGNELVIVIANFSDWGTTDPTNPNSHYIVHNWPNLPQGKKWREITQERDVSVEWAGKEPLMPWEAKVYATV